MSERSLVLHACPSNALKKWWLLLPIPYVVRWEVMFSFFPPGRGYPWPGQDGGTPSRNEGVPTPRPGMGYVLSSDGGNPAPLRGWGTPSRDRTTDLVLDAPRAVCLLRSRRRTL